MAARGGGDGKGVAPDIAEDEDPQLFQGVEQGPVAAPRAEIGRTAGELPRQGARPRRAELFPRDHLCQGALQDRGGQLPDRGNQVLPVAHLDSHGPDFGLQEGVQFLHHDHLFDLAAEIGDPLPGQGPHHAQLQEGIPGEELFGVEVGNAGGDDADRKVPEFGDVAGKLLLGVGFEFLQAPVDLHAPQAGVGGDHHLFRRVGAAEPLRERRFNPLPGFHRGVAVGHAGLAADQNGGIEAFAHVEGDPGEIPAFLGVGGLEHRQLSEPGPVAAVLLVLGAVLPGVVRHHDDEPPLDAGVGHGHQRVGGHVQAYMLHGDKSSSSRQRGPERHFQETFSFVDHSV